MSVSEAVELYRYAILHLSEQSQQWYSARLKQFAAWCAEQQIDLEKLKTVHIRQYIAFLQNRTSQNTDKKLSSYTVHGHARAIRAFLNWCSREEDLGVAVSSHVAKRIGLPHIEEKVIETFSEDQIKALFIACDKEYSTKLRWRDRAILSLLLDTGIRADELCTLTLEHCTITPESGYINVRGKGNKWRQVGLGKKSRAVIHRYITLYRHNAQKQETVFVSRFGRPLTVNGLEQLTVRLGDWAHIEGVRCSPHTFRHTFATRFLLDGGDLFILSMLMGHTSVQVTQRYLHSVKAQQARVHGHSVVDSLL